MKIILGIILVLLLHLPAYAVDVCVSVPADRKQEVVDAFASAYGYRATLDDGTPNPQTKAQFAKAIVSKFVREVTIAQRTQVVEDQKKTVIEQAITDLVNVK